MDGSIVRISVLREQSLAAKKMKSEAHHSNHLLQMSRIVVQGPSLISNPQDCHHHQKDNERLNGHSK